MLVLLVVLVLAVGAFWFLVFCLGEDPEIKKWREERIKLAQEALKEKPLTIEELAYYDGWKMLKVGNRGSSDIKEVLQLYIADHLGSIYVRVPLEVWSVMEDGGRINIRILKESLAWKAEAEGKYKEAVERIHQRKISSGTSTSESSSSSS